jgi:hypothetical protein
VVVAADPLDEMSDGGARIMLRSLKTIEGYVVSATDGEVGRVANFLFDDVARSESDGPRTRERKAHIEQDLRSPKS